MNVKPCHKRILNHYFIFFIWIFIGVLGCDVWGVWVGAGASVFFGWMLSIFIAYKVANKEIGGLWQKVKYKSEQPYL